MMMLAGRLATLSIYLSACATFASVCSIAAHFFGAGSYVWGLSGFLIPIFPMYWYYSQPSVMKKRLRMLKEFHEEGLLNQTEYRLLRKQALRWWAGRLFGPPQTETTIET
jgi:hypothetical protein